MADGDLIRKTQASIMAWLGNTATHSQTIGITARAFEEDDTDTLTAPALVVKVDRSGELEISTGIFEVTAEVIVRANADDTTEDVFEGYTEKVETILQWDVLATELSSALANFKCWGVSARGPGATEIDGRNWRWTYALTLWCQATD